MKAVLDEWDELARGIGATDEEMFLISVLRDAGLTCADVHDVAFAQGPTTAERRFVRERIRTAFMQSDVFGLVRREVKGRMVRARKPIPRATIAEILCCDRQTVARLFVEVRGYDDPDTTLPGAWKARSSDPEDGGGLAWLDRMFVRSGLSAEMVRSAFGTGRPDKDRVRLRKQVRQVLIGAYYQPPGRRVKRATLSRHLGVSTRQLREFMGSVPPETLPSPPGATRRRGR